MNVKTKGLSYVEDLDGFSRFTYFLEGRRVMDVLVNNWTQVDPPEGATLPPGVNLHVISIVQVDAPIALRQETKGFAASKPYLNDDGVGSRVDGLTIASYLEPRLAVMLARLFVPAAA